LIVHKLVEQRSQLRSMAIALLERVKLEPAVRYIDKFPHELSGGQRQRVAIARTLATEPGVLLADEPVSMLDVSVRLGVLNLLDELRRTSDVAMLYVTHDIASARYFADTVAVMYAGEIVEHGASGAITDSPTHPYTQLLLSAVPDPERPRQALLAAGGDSPSLVSPPRGCRFHTRCPHAMPICGDVTPPAFEVTPGHAASCWLLDPDHSGGDRRPSRRDGTHE
jgi:peptide/nickel transport system ATP-binding protein